MLFGPEGVTLMTTSYRMISVSCVLTLMAGVLGMAHSQALDLKARVDPLARQLVDDGDVVGLVVGVFRKGETQVLAYGETRKGSGDAPTGDTIYEIGSVSKAFTGVLVADMVATGDVELDDPLQKFVKIELPVHGDKPITLEHLATHTSGLPRLPDNMQPADWENPYADYTVKQVGEFLEGHKLRRAPGEYEYSNFGMGTLGYLLARHEKTNYERLMIARIAKPLGMNDTLITLNKEQRVRLAPPYDEALSPAKNWITPTLAGAGGIRSTANDMLKFIAANLTKDDTQLARSIRESHKKRYQIPGGAIGLGWHIHGDTITRWHNGQTGGYHSWISVVPHFEAGVVVLANTATDKVTELGLVLTPIACGLTVEPSTVAEEYPKRAPYTGVRWEEQHPAVKVGKDWFTLVSIDGVTTDDIVSFSRNTYGDKWRKRFEEDLVEVLAGMGHEPKDTVQLVVSTPGSSEQRTLKDVPMTEANRRAIREAAEEAEPPAGRENVEADPAVLESYVGVYEITPQFAMTVTAEGGQLMVQATGQGKLPLERESATKFSCKLVDAKIHFVREDDGKFSRLVLHQNGANQVATRREKVEGGKTKLASYEGDYAITPQFVMTVKEEDGRLTMQATGQGKIQLDRKSATKFSCRGVDAQLTFVKDDDGTFNLLILHQDGANQVATRQ
jgi:serine-type D-Ala-D-Ala carboxypeptidase/endopeptidase